MQSAIRIAAFLCSTTCLLLATPTQASANCDTGCYAICGCNPDACTGDATCTAMYHIPGTKTCNPRTGGYGLCTADPTYVPTYNRRDYPLPSLAMTADKALGVGFPMYCEPDVTCHGFLFQALATALRPGWTRVDVTKTNVQSYKYDEYMNMASQNGIRVIAILNCVTKDWGCPYTEQDRTEWVQWAIAMMQRFKGRGILWELMNEPNGGDSDWFHGTDPADAAEKYTLLAQALAAAVNDPANGVYEEYIVGPALAHTNSDSQAWLNSVFALGAGDRFDAITVHPYDQNHRHESAEEESGELDDTLLIAQNHGLPTYISEWGFENRESPYQYALPAREWLFSLSKGIPLASWYSWTDDCGADHNGVFHQFGLLTCDGQTKPAYWALKFVRDRVGPSHYVSSNNSGGVYSYQFTTPTGKRQYVFYSDNDITSDFSVGLAPGSYTLNRIRWPGGDGSVPLSYTVSSEPAVDTQALAVLLGATTSLHLGHMPVVITQM